MKARIDAFVAERRAQAANRRLASMRGAAAAENADAVEETMDTEP